MTTSKSMGYKVEIDPDESENFYTIVKPHRASRYFENMVYTPSDLPSHEAGMTTADVQILSNRRFYNIFGTVILVTHGDGDVTNELEELEISAGDLLYIPPQRDVRFSRTSLNQFRLRFFHSIPLITERKIVSTSQERLVYITRNQTSNISERPYIFDGEDMHVEIFDASVKHPYFVPNQDQSSVVHILSSNGRLVRQWMLKGGSTILEKKNPNPLEFTSPDADSVSKYLLLRRI